MSNRVISAMKVKVKGPMKTHEGGGHLMKFYRTGEIPK